MVYSTCQFSTGASPNLSWKKCCIKMIDRCIDWLVGWSVGRSVDVLIDWYWLIDWLIVILIRSDESISDGNHLIRDDLPLSVVKIRLMRCQSTIIDCRLFSSYQLSLTQTYSPSHSNVVWPMQTACNSLAIDIWKKRREIYVLADLY